MASAGKLEARITIPTGGWSVEVSDDTRSEVTATVAAGTYYLSSADSESENLIDALATAINASNASTGDTWTVTLDTSEGGTGRVTIDTDGTSFSVSWTSSYLRDLLGFTGSIESATTPQTGTNQAQSLWLGDYGWQAPHGDPAFQGSYITDMHTWVNSYGYSGGIIGGSRRESWLKWPQVRDRRAKAISETVTNESFESFLVQGIWAGKAWATVGGPIRFYGDLTVDTHTSWFIPMELGSWDPPRVDESRFWDGLWVVEIPRMVLVPDSGVGTGNDVTGIIQGTATGSATSSGTATGSVSGNIAGTATGSATSSGTATGSVASGVTQLLNLDFSTPLTSWTTGRTNFTSAFATDEWVLSSPTAGSYANNVGSATLANTGGLEDQAGRGIYDGTNYFVDAWEGLDDNDYLVCSDTSVGDVNSADLCIRIAFRVRNVMNSDHLLTKWNFSGGNIGWMIQFTGGGVPYVGFGNGATYNTTFLTSNHCDGAWHYITVWWDQSTQTTHIKSDLDSEVTENIAINPSNSSAALYVNRRSDGGGDAAHVQVAYVGVCEGANAQSMYDETFWQHAQDPTGLLDTKNRDCLISVPLGSWDAVGHFSGSATAPQLPIGDDGTFTSGYGLYCNSAVTNLIAYSRASTGATNSNVSATDNNSDANDGFRAATLLTASADNGYQAKTVTTVASTDYCGSVCIKQSTAGVTGRVIAYDESNSAELASTAFTGTGSWQRIEVPFSTVGGGVSTSLRVEIDTNTESVLVDHWQVELGDQAGAIIVTTGSSASLVYSDYDAQGTAGEYALGSAGEAEVVWNQVKEVDTGSEYLLTLSAGTSLAHWKAVYVNAAGTTSFNIRDASASVDTINDTGLVPGVQEQLVIRWDDGNGLALPASMQILDDMVSQDSSTATWTSADNVTHVAFGMRNFTKGDAYAMNGFIQSVKIWDGEGGAA